MVAHSPYYLIQLEPGPRFLQFHENRTENYIWNYEGRSPLKCEINYLQAGTLCEVLNDETRIFRQGTVRFFLDNAPRMWSAENGLLHELILQFWLSVPPVPMTEEEVARWLSTPQQAILTNEVTDPFVCQRIAALIKSAVDLHASNDIARELRMRSCMYECLAILTQYAVSQAQKNRQKSVKQHGIYILRACEYIESHLHECIRVADVAAYIGISYSYLKALFRKEMNTSLMEYINRNKIRLVERYITEDGMTMEQACQSVGLQETKYLTRLFRKYTGMTVQEYRRLYSEHAENNSISSNRLLSQAQSCDTLCDS